ncbi:hypothetical protein [Kitasatospora aureofaciens]|uniref:hypothetical protein n=1 Tax=Kitasatospora aureofaciens TaxID=1894 RepID=UPI0033C9157E
MTERSAARTAYEAYGDATDGKNFLGDPMPEWHDLPEPIRRAWAQAAAAILAHASYLLMDEGAARHLRELAEDERNPLPPVTRWRCPEPHEHGPAAAFGIHSSRREFLGASVDRNACEHITPAERIELKAGRVPARLAVPDGDQ